MYYVEVYDNNLCINSRTEGIFRCFLEDKRQNYQYLLHCLKLKSWSCVCGGFPAAPTVPRVTHQTFRQHRDAAGTALVRLGRTDLTQLR